MRYNTTVCARLDDKLFKIISDISKKKNESVSRVVRDILKKALVKNKKIELNSNKIAG